MSPAGTVIVHGGAGALGRALVSKFVTKGWKVVSVDLGKNDEATESVILKQGGGAETQGTEALEEVKKVLGVEGQKVQAILCVAGGWAGGGVKKTEGLSGADRMWDQSVVSSLVASHLAAHLLEENGLFLMTGAFAALEGTPGMVGYGIAKAAVHQLTQSLQAKGSGLPKGTTVTTILPTTLDTPGNRAGMPTADMTSWTPLTILADKVLEWAQNPAERMGGLVRVETVDSSKGAEGTRFTFV
ncbi:MAG: dihydropteridine reductase-like protein [Piptocephalis tieghemiana]|nr:MAG: dihydropteridine reductase-like protein [Piptocephalis tieghemiana]